MVHAVRNGSYATFTHVGHVRGVILSSVLALVACGGRSRSEHEMASFAGTGNAPGMTSGGTGGANSSAGGKTPGSCGRQVADYVAAECAGATLVCAPGFAVFADDCGCGCDAAPFSESDGTVATDTSPDACNGPSGPFALFETSPHHMIIGEDTVYVQVERRGGRVHDTWAIDKRTRAASIGTGWDGLSNAPGAIVSGPEPLESDGVTYRSSPAGMLTAEAGGETRVLFELPGYDPAFVVAGADVYTTSYDGELLHGRVDPIVPPELVERRGKLDDDDPYPIIVGVDRDAVYWTAGPYTDGQVTDGDPAMLYRTCR